MGYRYCHQQEVFCFCLNYQSPSLCSDLSGTPNHHHLTITPILHLSSAPSLLNPGHPPTASRLPSAFACFSQCLLKFSMSEAKMGIFPLHPHTHPNLSFFFSQRHTAIPVPGVYGLHGISTALSPSPPRSLTAPVDC